MYPTGIPLCVAFFFRQVEDELHNGGINAVRFRGSRDTVLYTRLAIG